MNSKQWCIGIGTIIGLVAGNFAGQAVFNGMYDVAAERSFFQVIACVTLMIMLRNSND